MVCRNSKVHYLAGSLFLSAITWSGHLTEIRWSPENFVCLIFQDGFLVVHIPFICMVKFKLLAQLPVDCFFTLSCLVLYSLCMNLLHSLNMWLIVSSLSSHNLHLLFCCFLSLLVLMAFCAAIRRDSVYLWRFPFISYIHIIIIIIILLHLLLYFICQLNFIISLKKRENIVYVNVSIISVFWHHKGSWDMSLSR